MISQAMITALLGPGRATGAGQGAFDRGARTRATWALLRGAWVPPRTTPDLAPCPRCGVDLRSPEHDFERMQPFREWDGEALTIGYRCRIREKLPPVVVEPESKGARDWKAQWAIRKGKRAAAVEEEVSA